MEFELTKEEKNWVTQMRKAFNKRPNSMVCYVVDASLVTCKRGVPNHDISEDLGDLVYSGVMLDDLHDRMDNGNDI